MIFTTTHVVRTLHKRSKRPFQPEDVVEGALVGEGVVRALAMFARQRGLKPAPVTNRQIDSAVQEILDRH